MRRRGRRKNDESADEKHASAPRQIFEVLLAIGAQSGTAGDIRGASRGLSDLFRPLNRGAGHVEVDRSGAAKAK